MSCTPFTNSATPPTYLGSSTLYRVTATHEFRRSGPGIISGCWGSPHGICRRRTPSARSVRVRGRIMAIRRLWRDEAGGALVEATVLISDHVCISAFGSVGFSGRLLSMDRGEQGDAGLGAPRGGVDRLPSALRAPTNIATLAVNGTTVPLDGRPYARFPGNFLRVSG